MNGDYILEDDYGDAETDPNVRKQFCSQCGEQLKSRVVAAEQLPAGKGAWYQNFDDRTGRKIFHRLWYCPRAWFVFTFNIQNHLHTVFLADKKLMKREV